MSTLANDMAVWKIVYYQNAVADATPIGKLTRMHTLEVSNNKLKDASPLAGLAELRIRFLSGNKI